MKTRSIILALAALCVVSCYDDYVGDYSVTGCGFANQTDVRSLIVGEGMTFSTGVALGGAIDNEEDRAVNFGVDYSLVSGQTYSALKGHTFAYIANLMKNVPSISALPANLYELKTDSGMPGTVIIRKGTHLGVITVKVDSAAFLADAGRLYPKQVIPLVITGTDGTDIIKGRESTVIGVRYENMLFGNWYHGGYAKVTDASGNELRTETYSTTIPQADNLVWTLTTTGPFELTANAVGSEFNGSAAQMKLTLGADDSITVSAVPGAKYDVQPDGESRFVRSKLLQDRKIVLNYKYVAGGGETVHAHDTLTFRNRLRDGVNEWQDENKSHYE
ncbi:MAG: DUF1735 domain-containing protein [Bacteroidales bacterium]|nr:DUF1735 domain-containing protein [Bacteroidales bacterium]